MRLNLRNIQLFRTLRIGHTHLHTLFLKNIGKQTAINKTRLTPTSGDAQNTIVEINILEDNV